VARFQRHFRDGDFGGALAQWGGTPLAGLDAPGLAAAVAGLAEQWLSAVEADLERAPNPTRGGSSVHWRSSRSAIRSARTSGPC